MKICVYANCQGDGIVHFLKKTFLGHPDNKTEWAVYHNWMMLTKEQTPEDLERDAATCDLFLYQPTPEAKYERLSTEWMVDNIVPKAAQKISFAYWYNHGFFPIIQHPGGFITGREVIEAMDGKLPAYQIMARYNADRFNYDCPKRFLECLAEQAHRERNTDVRLVPFILANCQKRRLFLLENHPASPLFVEAANQIIKQLFNVTRGHPDWDVSYADNEANLPGGMLPVHPAAARELGLEYGKGEDYDIYAIHLQALIASRNLPSF